VASPPKRPPQRFPRRTALAVGTAFAACVAMMLPAVPAQASPTKAELQTQVAALNSQIEVTIEQYNGIHSQLAKDQAKQKALIIKVNAASADSVIAQQHIGKIVRSLYMSGTRTGFTTLINATSTTELLNQMSMFDTIARTQSKDIKQTLSTLSTYKDQSAKLKLVIADEAKKDAALKAKTASIKTQLVKIQDLQRQLGYTITKGVGSARFDKAYVMPVTCPQVPGTGKGRIAALKACSLLYPIHMYGWATAGPSTYDCSGLTMTAWKAAGITLGHYTGDQWNESHAIAKSSLRPGDLIFYNGRNHVAIYIGNGWIVQAQHTGEPIMESLMTFEPAVSSGYRRINGT